MSKKIKITQGQQFGKLFVIKELEPYKDGHRKILCSCVCGNKKEIRLQGLRNGEEPSCGCRMKELVSKLKTTHGKSKSAEYIIYHSLLKRCYDKTSSDYHRYGSRGIIVQTSWRESFENFYQDLINTIGLRPSKLYSIDRIDNNGNYEKNNIKWSTKQEQANNRRSNKLITAFNRTQTSMQWQRETGISYRQITRRIFEWNWNIEDALTLLPDNHRRYSQNKKGSKSVLPDLSRSFDTANLLV